MKKLVTAVLMLSFIVFTISGCAVVQTPAEPHPIDEADISTEEMNMEETTADETVITISDEPLPESDPVDNIAVLSNRVDEPQLTEDNPQNITTQTETVTASPTPQPTITTVVIPQTQLPAPTPRPQATPASQPQPTPQPTPTPTPAPTPQPTPQPTPAPTPQPTPEPTPAPTPQPTPEPTPTPQARTICITCGADITGNVAPHGTVHLQNGENFSYRVE